MTECSAEQLVLPALVGQPVVVELTAPETSSDSGWLLLREAGRRLGLTRRLAACLHDGREPGKVRHELQTLLRQRVLQIAAGYEDCNDADRLRSDPVLKLCCGRRPEAGGLASQPTLSRFGNAVSWSEWRALRDALVRLFISRQARPPKEIVTDLDSTVAPDTADRAGQQRLWRRGPVPALRGRGRGVRDRSGSRPAPGSGTGSVDGGRGRCMRSTPSAARRRTGSKSGNSR